MATFDVVRQVALALPETDEVVGGHRGGLQWQVKQKLLVWDRPLGKNPPRSLEVVQGHG